MADRPVQVLTVVVWILIVVYGSLVAADVLFTWVKEHPECVIATPHGNLLPISEASSSAWFR